MLIIPAIDIKDGKCVRLFQGDYGRSKVYADDPSEMAGLFEEQGARLIHVVDLDGARQGRLVNLEAVRKIRQRVGIDIEVGGGVREKRDVEELAGLGINRIILGTSVIEDLRFLDNVRTYLRSLIISIDLKGKKLSTRGWLKETDISRDDFLKEVLKAGIREVIITDISRDGTLEGPNFDLYQEVADSFPDLSIIVSGGISSLDDLKGVIGLNRKNIRGIIIGKAIYEKKIDLGEALRITSK